MSILSKGVGGGKLMKSKIFWVLRIIGAINAGRGRYKKAPIVGSFPFL